VSAAEVVGFDKIFIIEGRSFMCIMESKGFRIGPWGTPLLLFPGLRKNSGFQL
jgi:hypothetical protein